MIKAFPNPHLRNDDGLNMRDWFAGLAMQGILANQQTKPDSILICKASYQLADEMMKAREQNDRMEEKTSVPKD